MKENSPAQDKLSFIVYEGSRVPRYYEIKRKLLKALIFGLPLITILSLSFSLGMIIYLKEIKNAVIRKEPAIIKNLKSKNEDLNKKLKEVVIQKNTLEVKLTSSSVEGGLDKLSIFRTPLGQKDLTGEAVFNLESPKLFEDKNGSILKFNIKNITPNQKRMSGYLHVVAKKGSMYLHSPETTSNVDDFSYAFSEGESFTTSRFRPFEVSFKDLKKEGEKIIFQVIIFSRTGDLLHRQTLSL